jgi:hypothetical protein
MVHGASPSQCVDGLWHILNSLDAIVAAGVIFEKPSARARCLQQPGKDISHHLFAVVTRPLENLNPMCVGLVFHLAAERAHHSQVGCQGRDVARPRDNQVEDKNADPESLDFREVAEISVCHLVGMTPRSWSSLAFSRNPGVT